MEKGLKGFVTDKMGLSSGATLYSALEKEMVALGIDSGFVGEFLTHCAELGNLRYGGVPDIMKTRLLLKITRNILRRLKREMT